MTDPLGGTVPAADIATSLDLFLIITGVTGVVALIGSVIGGGLGLKNVLGWGIGSGAFLLPMLVGSIGSVVVMLQVQKALEELDPVVADQIILDEFTRSLVPLGLGTALTVLCVVAFFIAGIVSGILRKRKQPASG
jgi:hypothetical protein